MAQDVCQPPSNDAIRAHERTIPEHRSLWSPLRRWFGREGKDGGTLPPGADLEGIHRSGVVRRISRKVVPGLPRPGTFRRQQSELRDNLEPVKSPPEERRTVSVDRRGYAPARDILGRGTSPSPRTSAPVFMENVDTGSHEPVWKRDVAKTQVSEVAMHDASITHAAPESVSLVDEQRSEDNGSEDGFLDELDRTWILNLSMHFRDRSNREKFFVTYAETAIRWRRVTISLDYRNAPPGSLEDELQKTRFQRDKSARIYESIRDSLCDIQFYDTVTNLKLQTEADRLHVHVTEDIHEVIHYPPVSAIAHLHCPRYREEEVNFDGHLSGFVYKVKVHNQVLIKKEIPGPDTVEEFLYEINALHCLSGSASVIQFGGVIVDNEEKLLKGLLISYAKQGALVDVLFDNKGDLPWQRRERWAKQVVQGLSEVHEAGFVQGDFTLSNIVIDSMDRAKIIDINRRGCPVGWEPPEVAALLESKQRVSMYIGVKSDLFQLGMVLWAIAMEQDEPEIQPRPLTLCNDAPQEIPDYYRRIVRICLSDDPRSRSQATKLLDMFPESVEADQQHLYGRTSTPDHFQTEDIDPATAVGRDDIENFRALSSGSHRVTENRNSIATHTYVNALTDISNEPYVYSRGRSPPARLSPDFRGRRSSMDYHQPSSDRRSGEHDNDDTSPYVHLASRNRHDALDELGSDHDRLSAHGPVPQSSFEYLHEGSLDGQRMDRSADREKGHGNTGAHETANQSGDVKDLLRDYKKERDNFPARVIETLQQRREALALSDDPVKRVLPLERDVTCGTSEAMASGRSETPDLEIRRRHSATDQQNLYDESSIHGTSATAEQREHDHISRPKSGTEDMPLSRTGPEYSTSQPSNTSLHESETQAALSDEPRAYKSDLPNGHVQLHPKMQHIFDTTSTPLPPELPHTLTTSPIPPELAGIGQHSTLDLQSSHFPADVLDDDLTTEMNS